MQGSTCIIFYEQVENKSLIVIVINAYEGSSSAFSGVGWQTAHQRSAHCS